MTQASPGGDRAALEVVHLSKQYRSRKAEAFEAVSDISFEVHAGECLGLLGPNGAGKSTTIQCLSGFFPTSKGKVSIKGFDVHTQPKEARAHLGVCSQEDTLDTDFSVVDQLIQHAIYFRIPRRIAHERAEKLLERFGLRDKRSQAIESLSGGLKRRLQVARALISEPSVLILDEPTTGLDPDVRRMLWDVLKEARQSGVAILLSTHYMEEAERVCDRVAVMSRGRILDIDSPEALIARHISKEMVEEEVRPGVFWKRPPNLEDVYLKVTGSHLGVAGL